MGGLLGKLEEARLLGLLREKENAYLGSFSWTQRTLNLSLGAIWNFSKQQGTTELISNYRVQGARL
jgi:hypothetical protein